jgi:hypothetical protein
MIGKTRDFILNINQSNPFEMIGCDLSMAMIGWNFQHMHYPIQ